MESRVLKALVVLGVPGVALGVFYLLLRQFGFSFSTIGAGASAGIAVLFLVIIGGVILFALHRWAPQRSDNSTVQVERYRGAMTAKFVQLRRTLEKEERRIERQMQDRRKILGDSPRNRLEILKTFAATVTRIEQRFNSHLNNGDIYRAHEELNNIKQMALEEDSLIKQNRVLFEQSMQMWPGGGGLYGGLIELHTYLRKSITVLLDAIDSKA
jgi:hypothetical protein